MDCKTDLSRHLHCWSAFALLTCVSLAFTGCGVGSTKLTERERARLIKEKRLEARDLLEKWRASDGQDIGLLEKYMKVNRETTEIAPATCPRCWGSYGESLSMIGFYYWGIHQDILDEAQTVKSAQKKRDLLKEAEQYQAEWEKYFTLSNQAYETHFRSKEVFAIHPYSYERVMRHYELLGNYERALTYLQKYLDGYPNMDEPNRQKIEKLRRIYKQELQPPRKSPVPRPRESNLRARPDHASPSPSPTPNRSSPKRSEIGLRRLPLLPDRGRLGAVESGHDRRSGPRPGPLRLRGSESTGAAPRADRSAGAYPHAE